MNLFALFAFGLLVFVPACCSKKAPKATEVEKTEVVQENITENTATKTPGTQIKF